MDEAAALFPPPPTFLKFSRTGVFSVSAFAFFAVPTVQGEMHFVPDSSWHYCTLLHASKADSI